MCTLCVRRRWSPNLTCGRLQSGHVRMVRPWEVKEVSSIIYLVPVLAVILWKEGYEQKSFTYSCEENLKSSILVKFAFCLVINAPWKSFASFAASDGSRSAFFGFLRSTFLHFSPHGLGSWNISFIRISPVSSMHGFWRKYSVACFTTLFFPGRNDASKTGPSSFSLVVNLVTRSCNSPFPFMFNRNFFAVE